MRIVLAGATGAIGRQLVPLLLQAGHEVTGLARSEARLEAIRAMGADALVADALDPLQVGAAVTAAAPDAVVHQLTAIPATIDPRRFAEAFESTNRLRREGTRTSSRRRSLRAPRGSWPRASLRLTSRSAAG